MIWSLRAHMFLSYQLIWVSWYIHSSLFRIYISDRLPIMPYKCTSQYWSVSLPFPPNFLEYFVHRYSILSHESFHKSNFCRRSNVDFHSFLSDINSLVFGPFFIKYTSVKFNIYIRNHFSGIISYNISTIIFCSALL